MIAIAVLVLLVAGFVIVAARSGGRQKTRTRNDDAWRRYTGWFM